MKHKFFGLALVVITVMVLGAAHSAQAQCSGHHANLGWQSPPTYQPVYPSSPPIYDTSWSTPSYPSTVPPMQYQAPLPPTAPPVAPAPTPTPTSVPSPPPSIALPETANVKALEEMIRQQQAMIDNLTRALERLANARQSPTPEKQLTSSPELERLLGEVRNQFGSGNR